MENMSKVHAVLSKHDYKELFNSDNSIEYREFEKQILWFVRVPSILTNYYSYKIITDGIKNIVTKNFINYVVSKK